MASFQSAGVRGRGGRARRRPHLLAGALRPLDRRVFHAVRGRRQRNSRRDRRPRLPRRRARVLPDRPRPRPPRRLLAGRQGRAPDRPQEPGPLRVRSRRRRALGRVRGPDLVARLPRLSRRGGRRLRRRDRARSRPLVRAVRRASISANARNVPLYLAHGTADSVVPDSAALFPYRNTHHIADTPGFADARGSVPTLSELHRGDPGGYVFQTFYPAGVDHVERGRARRRAALRLHARKDPDAPPGPGRRDDVRRDGTELLLGPPREDAPPDGTPSTLDATVDAPGNALAMRVAGDPRADVRVVDAGLDPSRPLTLRVDGGLASLRLSGPFPPRSACFGTASFWTRERDSAGPAPTSSCRPPGASGERS